MYEEMTPEKIKADILAGLTLDSDRREGSFADDMAGPAAVELSKMYSALNAVEPIVWVNETSGNYLDDAAAELGIEPRKEGVRAQAELTLTGAAGYTVLAGRLFGTENGLYFETLADVVIPQTQRCTVMAQAQQTGSVYNVNAGTIVCQFQNDSRITGVTNPADAVGGADAESDSSLFMRIDEGRKRPSTSGNVHDYERWAKETAGVGFSRCIPRYPQRGGVKVLVADEQRQPVDAAVVENCAAHIEEVRPVGADVTVMSVQPLPISVSATVALETGAVIERVAQMFTQALDVYLESIAFVRYEVPYNRIGALLIRVDGVQDYTQLLVNGGTANVTIGEDEVPTVGEVAIA